jgi:hypothetical protein
MEKDDKVQDIGMVVLDEKTSTYYTDIFSP